MNVLGLHLLLELKECNPKLLDDLDYVRETMLQAACDLGVHVVGGCVAVLGPSVDGYVGFGDGQDPRYPLGTELVERFADNVDA